MLSGLKQWLWGHLVAWLTREHSVGDTPLCDFERLSYEVRPGDCILVEGNSNVSDVIKMITQSPWTHSMLYIGRLHDIQSHAMRVRVQAFYDGDPGAQLVVEALMGKGTVVTPLAAYRRDHLRICRPRGLSPSDAQKVINYSISQLGKDYDVRQMLDLARFMFPYGILPRRWRSSLFQHNAGVPTRNVCSTLMVEAFTTVNFPVLPVVKLHEDGKMRFYQRNPRLFAPRDFDYSPYFDIIKYPYWGSREHAPYHQVPWSKDAVIYNDQHEVLEGAKDTDDAPGPVVPEPAKGEV
jgi:hypothetical protein